jgi:diaminohydroxyphosphoribosylaminopyrimidine deaminase / 5-amino-6-(5-phosphoribosylamino)uracil reductase
VTTSSREEDDRRWMAEAIALANRGLGLTSPNPIVGAVVVRDGAEVGSGWHRKAGEAHAEVIALREAGESARGSTLYVTLEPCAHTGRTGPCVDAIIAAGVARVVFAVRDPTPTAGGGAVQLQSSGVEVEEGCQAHEAARANVAWLHAQQSGRPYIIWKTALTLDGRVAATDGSSRWITSEEARDDVHALRATVDTIVVGTGTAIRDDPALTIRGQERVEPVRRVVVGLRDLPPTSQLAQANDLIHLRTHDPAEVISQLHAQGATRVLLEGGPTLATAFVAAGLVDEVVMYLAPALLGEGAPALGKIGVLTIDQIRRLTLLDVRLIGGDIRIQALMKEAR